MTVIDSGRNKKNSTIGHVTFPLRHLATEHPNDQLELLKMDLEKVSDSFLFYSCCHGYHILQFLK
ncbi:hypothetical protein O3M35_009704 [Rhynocoris fuscipes]|uniref:Uncharacterized protein n=1 Tax=Rhynocoris fuscipes TaxID=488301 RepID=A0AAW1D3X7_9HEMI